jgi:hypothetical protein
MPVLIPLLLALAGPAGPTCRTADARLEQLVAAKTEGLRGQEYCQYRLYHTLDDVDGDGAPDFVVVFAVEGSGGGGGHAVQFLVLFPSARQWEPITAEVGKRGERFVEGIEVDGQGILLRTSEYEKDDAACCPSGRGALRYTFVRGRLLASAVTRK